MLPLAQAGLEVVALEAGGRFSVRDFHADEIRNDIRNWFGRAKVNEEVPTQRRTASEASVPAIAPGRMMNAVGGTSIHWTCQSWRLMPWNFNQRSETIRRYGAGALPVGSTLTDWPLDYEELEPYYDKVEFLHGVSGKAGNLGGTIDPRGNVFEGARGREYPLPPLRRTGFTEFMADAARRLGWHPFPGPSAIRSQPYNGLSACDYHGFCTWGGCHVNAKGSTNLTAIPMAEATRNLEVIEQARAVEITVDRDGRANGVRYLKGRKLHFLAAKAVLLAGYTYENTRLLLLSKSAAYPNGLSNNHGQVGRHYLAHVRAGANGVIPGRRLNRFSGTASQWTAVDDWDSDFFDHASLGFTGGGTISAGMEAKPIGAARTTPPSVPRWGSAWKAWLKDERDLGGVGGDADQRRAVRGHLPRPRSRDEGPRRVPGRPGHERPEGERAPRRALRPGEVPGLAARGGRLGGVAGRAELPVDPDARLRRHADGRRPRCRRHGPVVLLP